MQDNRINACYFRLSLEDGDVAAGNVTESCSIASQRLCVEQFLGEHKELGDGFQEFIDDGYSGTSMERPAIRRLLGLVQQGMVKTIIVRDLSRFARNYLEAGHYLEFIFPAHGVRFISINDHYDSGEHGEAPAGLDLVIRNLINELYSRDISGKIKSAVDLKKRKGEYVYGIAPFGYKKGERKNTIVVDEEAAATVRRIFSLAVEGKTVTEIARLLNREKVPTPSRHLARYRSSRYKVYPDWTWSSVKNILENRIYTGDTELFKSHVVKIGSDRTKQIPRELREIIPETHEAIVSRETYFLALSTIRTKAKAKGVPRQNPLTSKLVCGCCGSTLSKGKEKNRYWLCQKGRYVDGGDCQKIRVEETEIRGILLRAIRQQCALADIRLSEQRKKGREADSEYDLIEAELRRLRKKCDKLQNDRQELLEAVLEERISKQDYLEMKQKVLAEEEKAKAGLAILQQRHKAAAEAIRETKAGQEREREVGGFGLLTELTPEVMRALVKRVLIYPDRRIRIEWSFQESLPEHDTIYSHE